MTDFHGTTNMATTNTSQDRNIYHSKTSQMFIFTNILIGVALILLQVYLDILAPQYLTNIMKEIYTPDRSMSNILLHSCCMIGCVFCSMVSAIICAILVGRFATTIAANMRHNVFGKIISLSPQDLERFSVNSLITRATNDITQIQTFISIGFQAAIKVPIISIWICYKIRNMDISWLVTILSFIFVLLIVVLTIVMIVIPKYDKIQTMVDKLNGAARDNITGIKVIHAYNAEQYQIDKVKAATAKLTKTEMYTNMTIGFMPQLVAFMLPTLTLAIYWIAKLIINKNPHVMHKTMTDMMIVNLYSIQLVVAVMMVAFVIMILPKAVISIRRIREIQRTKQSIVSWEGHTYQSEHTNLAVEFRNVSFKYGPDGGNVLDNINVGIAIGSTVAIVGATGCGKTSLVNLIPRLYDANSGQVLINGLDVKNYNMEDLRRNVSLYRKNPSYFQALLSQM